MNQVPTVGRVVHVTSPGWDGVRPAIVTGVNDNGSIDAQVFFRDCDIKENQLPSGRISNVPQLDPERGAPGEGVLWQWPPTRQLLENSIAALAEGERVLNRYVGNERVGTEPAGALSDEEKSALKADPDRGDSAP